MDKQALHIAGSSVLLSRENRSCCDSTVSTCPPKARNVTLTKSRAWIAAGSSPAPPALHGPAPAALGSHSFPHMYRFCSDMEKTTQQMFSASTLSAGTTCSVFLVSIPQSLEQDKLNYTKSSVLGVFRSSVRGKDRRIATMRRMNKANPLTHFLQVASCIHVCLHYFNNEKRSCFKK